MHKAKNKDKKFDDLNIKDALMLKAVDLFYEKGYASSSVREIVKAVGVSNSVLYHHFQDKNELLFAIIEKIGSELIKELRRLEEEIEDPIKALSLMILTQVGIVKEKKKEAKIFLEEQYQLNDAYKKKIFDQHREIYNIYKRQLDKLEKMGKLRNINKTVANFGIIAMMNWSYRWYREDGPLSVEEVADAIRDLFFYGILRRF